MRMDAMERGIRDTGEVSIRRVEEDVKSATSNEEWWVGWVVVYGDEDIVEEQAFGVAAGGAGGSGRWQWAVGGQWWAVVSGTRNGCEFGRGEVPLCLDLRAKVLVQCITAIYSAQIDLNRL